METEPDDEELVAATLRGDPRAFDELLERYQGKIYNLALRVTGNPEDAMDAAQAAFLKVYENLRRFDPSHRFFSWVYRIGLNQALDIVARRRRFADLGPEVEEPAAGPERVLFAHQVGEGIQAALLELKPTYRAAVILRHFHGLTYEEMSQVIGIPVKTVKSRLFTARRQLREMLTAKGLAPR